MKLITLDDLNEDRSIWNEEQWAEELKKILRAKTILTNEDTLTDIGAEVATLFAQAIKHARKEAIEDYLDDNWNPE